MKLGYTVYMNYRDVSAWVESLSWGQPTQELYREFSVTFAGWNAVEEYEEGARWDIFASHDPTDPRSECVIRAGVIPPDREGQVVVTGQEVPKVTLKGYEQFWLAQRRRPSETLVLVPGSGILYDIVGGHHIVRENTVKSALEAYDQPVGRYRVLQYVNTVHEAIRRLSREAGFNVETRFQDAPLTPMVIDPEKSYWQVIDELSRSRRVRKRYRRATNTLLLVAPESDQYGIGQTLNLGSGNVVSVDGMPVRHKRIRRIIMRFRPGSTTVHHHRPRLLV